MIFSSVSRTSRPSLSFRRLLLGPAGAPLSPLFHSAGCCSGPRDSGPLASHARGGVPGRAEGPAQLAGLRGGDKRGGSRGDLEARACHRFISRPVHNSEGCELQDQSCATKINAVRSSALCDSRCGNRGDDRGGDRRGDRGGDRRGDRGDPCGDRGSNRGTSRIAPLSRCSWAFDALQCTY